MNLPLQSFIERSLYVIMLLIVGFNIFMTVQMQGLVNDHQEATVIARKASIERQSEMEGYIKCILLLRYDNPNLTQNSPRKEVEVALDKCAQSTAD